MRMLQTAVCAVAAFLLLAAAPAYATTVTGTIRYTDRTFDRTGFIGVRYLPVPYAKIELWTVDSDTGNPVAKIDTTTLTNEGAFSFTELSSVLGANALFQIKVFSDTTNLLGTPQPVRVLNLAGDVFSISFRGAGLVTDGSGFWTGNPGDLDTAGSLTISQSNSGPFNILYCIAWSSYFVAQLEDGAFPPRVTVRWETGSTQGTYTESISQEIFLLGEATRDSDEFDDDVIVHEFGHVVTYNYSKDDSPGGYHFGALTDLRLAWTEAWSGYFSAWMTSRIESHIAGTTVYDSVYVDTRVSAATSWDLEPPSAAGFPGVYDNDEISISAGLWDIFDPANEAWDPAFSFGGGLTGETATWNTYRGLTTLSSATQVTFEQFWLKWFDLGNANQTAMDSIFKTKLLIDLHPDAFEDDGSAEASHLIATDGIEQIHTFAPVNDTDWVYFEATAGTTYAVATLDLINGADTVITIFNPTLTQTLATNDNVDSSHRSSYAEFTAAVSGRHFVRITQKSIVTYALMGGYKVRVTVTDAGPEPTPTSSSGGGCFISTAAFGTMAATAVTDLCSTRDLLLTSSTFGAAGVSLYYTLSPAIAREASASPGLRALLRSLIE